MGINGFLPFLKKKYPHIFRKEHISLFAFNRVFIDISGYIYKYICTYGNQTSKWIEAILYSLSIFSRYKLIPIPVFDGKPPSQKEGEIEDRKEKKRLHQQRLSLLSEAIEAYENGTYQDHHLSMLREELQKSNKRSSESSSLLHSYREQKTKMSSIVPFSLEEINEIKEHYRILAKQFISITSVNIQDLKTALENANYFFIQAPSESEGYCCTLTRKEEGLAVVSADSDCIIHGAKILILSIEKDGMITFLEHTEVLETLHLTSSQLIDYGILMGCDYNKHIKTNKLGPVNALKLIREYKSIENIPNDVIDKKQLLTEDCREMFQFEIEESIEFSHQEGKHSIKMIYDEDEND